LLSHLSIPGDPVAGVPHLVDYKHPARGVGIHHQHLGNTHSNPTDDNSSNGNRDYHLNQGESPLVPMHQPNHLLQPLRSKP
jgi:hypothetical protein